MRLIKNGIRNEILDALEILNANQIKIMDKLNAVEGNR
jgi:hypothetical protein